MLRILKPGGRLLLYNWAYEQNGRRKGSKRSHKHARATIGHWPCSVRGSAPAFVLVSQHLERGSRVWTHYQTPCLDPLPNMTPGPDSVASAEAD